MNNRNKGYTWGYVVYQLFFVGFEDHLLLGINSLFMIDLQTFPQCISISNTNKYIYDPGNIVSCISSNYFRINICTFCAFLGKITRKRLVKDWFNI